MTDPRDLIKRMADELDHYRQLLMDDKRETHLLATEARAYLAQPEPEEPTDEELRRRYLTWWGEKGSAMRPHPKHDHEEHARRISEIAWTNGAYVARQGRPALKPVPVSERLPGPEDCDADGRCWWLKQAANPEHDLLTPTWHLQRHGPAGSKFFKYTHWLPHWALPVPAQHS